MWKGCLFLFAVFLITLLLNWYVLGTMAAAHAAVVSFVLAGSVTLFAGGLWGVVDAARTRRQPESDRSHWRHGQKIRVGGTVQSLGRPLRTPVSGAEAVAVECEMEAATTLPQESASSAPDLAPPSLRVLESVPFGLQTTQGIIPIRGMPFLRKFPHLQYDDRSMGTRSLSFVLERRWESTNLQRGLASFGHLVNSSGAEMRISLANPRAVRTLFAPEGQPAVGWLDGQAPQLQGQAAVDTLGRRLAARPWRYREYSLAPGAEVTVEGTYQEDPPRIEVGRWMLDGSGMHAFQPGLAAATASAQWWQAIAFTTVIGLVSAALHVAIFARGGTWYREFLAWTETWPR